MEYLLFEGIYENSRRLLGEEATRQLIFLSVREAVKRLINDPKLKKELKKMSYCDVFKYVFSLFDVNEVACSEDLEVVVRGCPLPDRHDPNREGRACVIMIAILAGVAEVLTDKRILVETPMVRFGSPHPDLRIRMVKSKVLGDCCCIFKSPS